MSGILSKVVRPVLNNVASVAMKNRSVISKGNGLRRFIVEGFSANPSGEIKLAERILPGPIRRVISGYVKGDKPFFVRTNRVQGRVQNFLPTMIKNRMQRFLVRDMQSERVRVQGFLNQSNSEKVMTNPVIKTPVPLKKEDIFAQERRVIQGFTPNPSETIMKKMDLNNTSPRAVVKGFSIS